MPSEKTQQNILRTLKDLRIVGFPDYIQQKDLRQEAIKWIKQLEGRILLLGEYKNDSISSSSRFAFRETINWIKHFFNIREEETKLNRR